MYTGYGGICFLLGFLSPLHPCIQAMQGYLVLVVHTWRVLGRG